jgi:sarcosine oxidase subunit gamma
MSELQPVSALDGASAASGLAVRVEEAGLQGMILMRGDFASDAFRSAASGIAGAEFPAQRRASLIGARRLLWMAPDEALIVLPYPDVAEAQTTLADALGGTHHLIINVSDARALFRLTGDGAREVLAKGAPVDLARGVFGVGDLRRTHLGQVAAAFWQAAEDSDVFELVCFRSVAGYVFDWLVASAARGSLPGHL